MKTKIEKSIFKNIADIHICRIDCTPKIITKLLEMFTLSKKVEMIVSINFEENQSLPIGKIEAFSSKYETSFLEGEHNNGMFNLMVLPWEYENALSDIFDFEVENIAIYSVNGESELAKDLSYNMSRKLVVQKKLNLFITVMVAEEKIAISLNKEAFDVSKVVARIKELF